MNTFPIWWPEKPPIYDIKKSYLENFKQGPFFKGKIPERIFPPEEKWINFLGFSIASPLGVPAGPLLNSSWVIFAATMGFDIVTYKTIRSQPHPAHPLPNMIYIDTQGVLTYKRCHDSIYQSPTPPLTMHSLATTNSFGIPSQDRGFLVEDIACANAGLCSGQVMIVSVVGTPRDQRDFFEDFVTAASIAIRGGAKIIEADLSCPNVLTCEGSLFMNPQAVLDISQRIKQVIQSVPLVIKVGLIEDKEVIRSVMCAAAQGGASAICGINTVSMQIITKDQRPALGQGRLRAGVCGDPIRPLALDFIEKAVAVNEEEQLGMTIMGTGGVTLPDHFDEFFNRGADVAMSAVGMMWDPYLAMRYLHKC
ncbi:MAG: hypothetical protein R3E91_02845 [Chlamydiales bacterium]